MANYFRLTNRFFNRTDVVLLEAEKDGFKYLNFLLKLYAIGVKHDGRLVLHETLPYDVKTLAHITRFNERFVEIALERLQFYGFVEITEEGVICMKELD